MNLKIGSSIGFWKKTGWKIMASQKWINPPKSFGVRSLLRYFTPRHYIVYAENQRINLKIYIVIPAHNEEDNIEEALESLVNQQLKPTQLVVVMA